MSWRQVLPHERFEYDYRPRAGILRGYAVSSLIFLHGHEFCGCYRSAHPDTVTWFLQHNDEEHGIYPMHDSYDGIMLARLHEQLPALRPGFIVQVDASASYGQISVRR